MVLELPPVENREVGQIAKDEINGMRAGRIEDTRGWIVPVQAGVTIEM